MNLAEFMDVFLAELDEQLLEMEQAILFLEKHDREQELVNTLFRIVHTLKGSSAAMGFENMKLLSHEMEYLLDEVRNQRSHVSEEMVNLFFRCHDAFTFMRFAIESDSGDAVDITNLVADLRGYEQQISPIEATPGDPVAPQVLVSSESESKVIRAVREGFGVYQIQIQLESATVFPAARAQVVLNTLSQLGEVVETIPSVETMDKLGDALEEFSVVFVQKEEVSVTEFLESTDVVRVQVLNLSEHYQESSSKAGTRTLPTEDKATGMGPSTEGLSENASRRAHSVRVDVGLLEDLVNLVGELVIDQTRIEQVGRTLNRRYEADEEVRKLPEISSHVSRVVSQLQDHVMKARMQPIESLFARFPRIVRDLSKALTKEINLVIEGQETQLDRTVIEEIGDPLIHLIRNAVDHGIEDASLRSHSNKPVIGTIRLTAAHEENKVVISVQDDGAGIDAEKIRQSAIRKGVVSEAEAAKLSDTEALNLIFRPGFSTASQVTDISGRGVGMDIVRNHIEKLNGTIEIQTELGVGTVFKIQLPLTMAIIPGLLVGVGGDTFVVPMNHVVEITRVTPDSIQFVDSKPVITIRGRVLPVIDLNDYFGRPRQVNVGKYIPVVIVGTAEKRVALAVEVLLGNQEIVKKSLDHNLGMDRGISGATILGTGKVGLIIDISSVCKD